jgi:hypothetical protein
MLVTKVTRKSMLPLLTMANMYVKIGKFRRCFFSRILKSVVIKYSDVSKERSIHIIRVNELVWTDDEAIQRNTFVGYIGLFGAFWPITATYGGNMG